MQYIIGWRIILIFQKHIIFLDGIQYFISNTSEDFESLYHILAENASHFYFESCVFY